MRKILVPVAVMMVGALVVVGSLAISVFAYRRVIEPAGAMTPTFDKGDRLSIRTFDGATAQRGDVVVFSATAWCDDYELVKRVVGIGGDTVVCCDEQNRIAVNGKVITESYTSDGTSPTDAYAKYIAKVDPGHVWVLGDNRGNSRDSRIEAYGPSKGLIPVGDIRGVVVQAAGKEVGTMAFVDAGLSGAPFKDELDKWTYILLGLGGAVFVGGIVWLLVAIRRRGA